MKKLLLPLYQIAGAFFLWVASLRQSWRGCLPSGHSGSPLLLAVIVLLPVAGAVAEHTQLPNAEPRRRLQTALTNANIHAAVDACLAEDAINMVCPNTEYGDAVAWDVSGVTNFYHRQFQSVEMIFLDK